MNRLSGINSLIVPISSFTSIHMFMPFSLQDKHTSFWLINSAVCSSKCITLFQFVIPVVICSLVCLSLRYVLRRLPKDYSEGQPLQGMQQARWNKWNLKAVAAKPPRILQELNSWRPIKVVSSEAKGWTLYPFINQSWNVGSPVGMDVILQESFFHPTTNLEGKLSSELWQHPGTWECTQGPLNPCLSFKYQLKRLTYPEKEGKEPSFFLSIILVAIICLSFLKQLVLEYSSFCLFPSLNSHKNFILHVFLNTLVYCYCNSYYL